ncbi:MAG TPA: hypothetical protein PKZ92_02520 [Candidatus Woesebacteria bacterium]|nr:hypothetical protein [Candidatus Shapirobacteria bacterium]HOR02109.1 hypothetical protein [Candidatus Woesebacteria bacterium]
MQVYFIASSRLVAKNKQIYERMYRTIGAEHKMVSNKVWQWIKKGVADLSEATIETKKDNYQKTIKAINKSDIVVMEISGHSMSMGYILSQALEQNKPVVVLYKKGMEPIFVRGIVNSKLILAEYDQQNLEKVIREAIDRVKGLVDVRFNFFVSPRILNYLTWVSEKRRIPKAVFLRHLIEREMKKEREFKG